MTILDGILEDNKKFVENFEGVSYFNLHGL